MTLVTLRMAALRGDIPLDEFRSIYDPHALPFIDQLLLAASVLKGIPSALDAERVKQILTAPADKLTQNLFSVWQESMEINELRLLPGLTFEGQWVNDPLKPRQRTINLIKTLPEKKWFEITAFSAWVHDNQPDFLRSGGEYDQWFIKQKGREEYLKGFSTWPLIDGALLNYFITGPLNWFGIVEIAHLRSEGAKTAFRRSGLSAALLKGQEFPTAQRAATQMMIQKNGEMLIPRNADREMLYHFSRFCKWTGANEKFFKFQLNAAAIRRAETQGINQSQIIALLKKYAQAPLPANIFKAVERWGNNSETITVNDLVVVRFATTGLLDKFKQTPVGKLIIEELNPTTVVINRGDIFYFEKFAAENGYLAEVLAKYNH